MIAASARHVIRFERLSPEPSLQFAPRPVRTPHPASVDRIVSSPDCQVPDPDETYPISLTSISAVLLSLVWSNSTSTSVSGRDVDRGERAGVAARGLRVQLAGAPAILIPLATSRSYKIRAAERFGLSP